MSLEDLTKNKTQEMEPEVSKDLLPLVKILELYGVEIVSIEEDPLELKVRLGPKWTANIITRPVSKLKGLTLKLILYLLR